MTTTCTVKSLLPLVLFVLVVQVSAVPFILPSQAQANEKANELKIEEFYEEVKMHNSKAYIRRVAGRESTRDVITQDPDRYAKRTIAVTVAAYWNVYVDKDNPNDHYRHSTERNRYDESILYVYPLFRRFNLIPSLKGRDTYFITMMIEEGRRGVLRELQTSYYKSIQDEQFENAIASLLKPKTKRNRVRELNKLANYVVPLAKEIFWAYDVAIDYITNEYNEHCINPNGIVLTHKMYYLFVWWSSVKYANRQSSEDDWTVWGKFMATACTFQIYEKPKEQDQLQHGSRAPLVLENFDQIVAVPEAVKTLWPHLPMMKGSKNSELMGQLVASFGDYKKLNHAGKMAHDDDLWIGYQKKLIVLQTIVRVMRKDKVRALNYLSKKKEEFKALHKQKPTNPIPRLIVTAVNRALSRSNYYQMHPKPFDILRMALIFLYEHNDVQFTNPEDVPPDDDLGNRQVIIPKEIKILLKTTHLVANKLIYSEVIDTLILRFDLIGPNFTSYEELSEVRRNKVWAQLLITIVPKLVEKLSAVSQITKKPNPDDFNQKPANSFEEPEEVFSDLDIISTSQPSQQTWCESGQNWASKNPCYAVTGLLGVIGIGALSSFLAYWAFGNHKSPITTSEAPFSNITLSTESPFVEADTPPLKLVWWIVGVMIVGAIVCCAFFLIRRNKKCTESTQEETLKIKKDKKSGRVRKTANGPTRVTPASTPIDTIPTPISTTRETPISTINTTYITPSKYDPTTLSIWNAWFGTKPPKPKSSINTPNDARQTSQIQSGQAANSQIRSLDSRVVSSSPTASSSTTFTSNSPSKASSGTSSASTFNATTASSAPTASGASVISIASSSATGGESSKARTLKVSPNNVSQKSSSLAPSSSSAIHVTPSSKKVTPPTKKSHSQVAKSSSKSALGKAQSPTGTDTTKPGDPTKDAQKKDSKM